MSDSSPAAARLVAIEPGPKLRLADHMTPEASRLRPEVLARLQRAAGALAPGEQILVLDAFRTQSRQLQSWNRRLAALARAYPALDDAALSEMCRRDVADPVNKPSGHQSGAAIDVTLLEAGREIDMGSAYGDFSTRGTPQDRVRTQGAALMPTQRANRQRLLRAMAAAGFVNYPEEWWHFSYGDRLWAQIRAFGHDDATRAGEQVARGDYPFVGLIDSPLFEVAG